MIYLVSKQQSLFETDVYKPLSLKDCLEMCMEKSWIEFDSETEGLDPYTKRLLCTQYGLGEDQIVVDNTTVDIELLRCLLEHPNKTFLGWNLSFDLKFLYHHRIVPYNVWDGMIAEKLLYLGYPAQFHSLSLKSASELYLGIDLDKSVRGQIATKGLTPAVVNYAAHDVKYLTAIKEKQDKELIKKDLVKAAEFEMKFVPCIAYMEYCGAKIDKQKWKHKMDLDQKALTKAESELNGWVENYYNENKGSTEYTVKAKTSEVSMLKEFDVVSEIPNNAINVQRCQNDGKVYYSYDIPFPFVKVNHQGDLWSGFDLSPRCCINWGSSKQSIPFFEFIGLDCSTIDPKTKTKKKSASIKVISPQKNKSSVVPLYEAYSKAAIIVDTFGQKFLDSCNPVSDRIHPSYFQLGADTGRLSATNPSLMNMPSDEYTRACFVSEPGNKWISIDYSGQESFLMASIANDKAMLDELINGSGDLHSLTARMVFDEIPDDYPLEKIAKEYHDYRKKAKGYEFGFNYGGDWNTIMHNFGLKKKEAQKIYNNYMSGFAGLREYQDFRRQDVLDKGYILLNPITRHKAFVYDFDKLCQINEELESLEGNYMTNRFGDNEYKRNKEFLRKRISASQKQSINYPIQHAGSMCFKLSLIKFFNYLRKNNLLFIVKYCAPVHDEHNIEAPEEIADEMAKVLLECMERAAEPFCTRAKLTGTIEISDHWIH